MPIIKLFEQWLNEAEPAKSQGAAAPTSVPDLKSDIAENSLKKPFVSKVKPNFIVHPKLPMELSSNKTQWLLRVGAYELVTPKEGKGTRVKDYSGLYEVTFPAEHPSMKNTSKMEGPYVSREGNPAPADEFIAKAGGQVLDIRTGYKIEAETQIGPMFGNGTLADLYATLTDFQGTTKMPVEDFVALIEAAKPGAKADLIAQCTTGPLSNSQTMSAAELAKEGAYKAVIDWAKAQGGQTQPAQPAKA